MDGEKGEREEEGREGVSLVLRLLRRAGGGGGEGREREGKIITYFPVFVFRWFSQAAQKKWIPCSH